VLLSGVVAVAGVNPNLALAGAIPFGLFGTTTLDQSS
jgi:hypothetical protein